MVIRIKQLNKYRIFEIMYRPLSVLQGMKIPIHVTENFIRYQSTMLEEAQDDALLSDQSSYESKKRVFISNFETAAAVAILSDILIKVNANMLLRIKQSILELKANPANNHPCLTSSLKLLNLLLIIIDPNKPTFDLFFQGIQKEFQKDFQEEFKKEFQKEFIKIDTNSNYSLMYQLVQMSKFQKTFKIILKDLHQKSSNPENQQQILTVDRKCELIFDWLNKGIDVLIVNHIITRKDLNKEYIYLFKNEHVKDSPYLILSEKTEDVLLNEFYRGCQNHRMNLVLSLIGECGKFSDVIRHLAQMKQYQSYDEAINDIVGPFDSLLAQTIRAVLQPNYKTILNVFGIPQSNFNDLKLQQNQEIISDQVEKTQQNQKVSEGTNQLHNEHSNQPNNQLNNPRQHQQHQQLLPVSEQDINIKQIESVWVDEVNEPTQSLSKTQWTEVNEQEKPQVKNATVPTAIGGIKQQPDQPPLSGQDINEDLLDDVVVLGQIEHEVIEKEPNGLQLIWRTVSSYIPFRTSE